MRLTIVAVLAAASLPLALLPALAAHDGSPSDPTGSGRTEHQGRVATDLGVNITMAGDTPAEVQQFLDKLKPETRQLVLGGMPALFARARASEVAANDPVLQKGPLTARHDNRKAGDGLYLPIPGRPGIIADLRD